MATKSGLFQASFSVTLLRGAVLSIALIVQASPARSETLDLICVYENSNVSFRFLVDMGLKTLVKIDASGNKVGPHAATISDQFITYSESYWEGKGKTTRTIDRMSGFFEEIDEREGTRQTIRAQCRRSTQKF